MKVADKPALMWTCVDCGYQLLGGMLIMGRTVLQRVVWRQTVVLHVTHQTAQDRRETMAA